jgi:hypothetical protein
MDLDQSHSASSKASVGGGRSDSALRDPWDQALSAAMREIAVPATLKQQILSRLELPIASPAVAPPQSDDLATAAPRRSRLARRSLLSAAIALFVLCGAWWTGWLTPAGRPTIAMADLLTAQWNLKSLPAYAGTTPVHWPDGWKSVSGLKLQSWKAAPLPGRTDGATIAVAEFEFRHRELPAKITGQLMLVPVTWFVQPPAAKNMQDGDIRYHGPHGFVIWQEGQTICVCLLHSDPGALNLLRDTIANSRPVT